MTTPVTHSPLYAYLLSMYLRGVLTEDALNAAVAKGKITQSEATEIRAAKLTQDAAAVAAADASITADLTS